MCNKIVLYEIFSKKEKELLLKRNYFSNMKILKVSLVKDHVLTFTVILFCDCLKLSPPIMLIRL